MKHLSVHKILMMLAILASLTAITLIAIDDRLINQDYTANHVKAQHTVTVAIITDLHGSFYGDDQKEIITPLKNRRPDMILLGGDIYDDDLPPTNTDVLLRQLTSITPNVYYVNGNHELYLSASEYAKIEDKIKSYGIKILHGESAVLSIDGKPSNIHIHGVSDPVFVDKFNQDLHTVGKLASSDHINILLTHRPEHIDDYLQYPLTLSSVGMHTVVNGAFPTYSMDCLPQIKDYFQNMLEEATILIIKSHTVITLNSSSVVDWPRNPHASYPEYLIVQSWYS